MQWWYLLWRPVWAWGPKSSVDTRTLASPWRAPSCFPAHLSPSDWHTESFANDFAGPPLSYFALHCKLAVALMVGSRTNAAPLTLVFCRRKHWTTLRQDILTSQTLNPDLEQFHGSGSVCANSPAFLTHSGHIFVEMQITVSCFGSLLMLLLLWYSYRGRQNRLLPKTGSAVVLMGRIADTKWTFEQFYCSAQPRERSQDKLWLWLEAQELHNLWTAIVAVTMTTR